jgi:hypothetical protein
LRTTWATIGPIARRQFLSDLVSTIDGIGPRQSDPVGDFLFARTRRLVGARTQSTALHRAYLEWAGTNDGTGLTVSGLAKALHALGLKSIKSSVIVWLDLELLPRARAAA